MPVPPSARRTCAGLAVALFALALSSCGDGRKTCYPVSGQVLVDGKPAPDCHVYLNSTDPAMASGPDRLLPLGIADEAGNFKLSTYESGDGAPAGEYVVTFTWRRRSGLLKNQFDGPDRLKGKYGDPTKSTVRLTVDKKPMELPPFELTTK